MSRKASKNHGLEIPRQDPMAWEEWTRNKAQLPADIQALEDELSKAMNQGIVADFTHNLLKMLEYMRFEEMKKHYADPTGYQPRLYCDGLKNLEGRLRKYLAKG